MDMHADRSRLAVNMHPLDRAASGAIGGALLRSGLRRGALPGALLALAGVGMLYRGITGNCPGYTALGLSTTSAAHPDAPGARDDAPVIERWTTVGMSRDALYAMLQDPDTLPRMMGHFADVRLDGDRLHWRIGLPWGRALEWEARLFERRPGERIGWMSEPGAAVRSEGSIRLADAPGGRGTQVTLQVAWTPPGGSLGGAAIKLLRVAPEAVAQRALQRLKSLAETGEIADGRARPVGSKARPASAFRAAAPATGRERAHEGGLLVRRARRARRGRARSRASSTRATPSCASPRPRSAARTCTSTTASSRRWSSGDILGHEFMGEVVEVGPRGEEPQGRRPRRRAVPDRLRPLLLLPARAVVAVRQLQSRTPWMAEKLWGSLAGGLFGYSHLFGGYAGGQAEYVRVPFADVGPLKVPDGMTDEQVLFLSDIFPTGYMAAENCDIQPGDTVAVWGCGPVGQFAIRSALPARRRAGDRHRPRSRAAAHGARARRRRDDRLRARSTSSTRCRS